MKINLKNPKSGIMSIELSAEEFRQLASCKCKGVDTKERAAANKAPKRSRKVRFPRNRPNYYKRWSKADVGILVKEVKEGKSIRSIAKQLGRNVSGCRFTYQMNKG